MEEIIQKLTLKKEIISVMESCTGGALANALTNVPGSSEVFKFGAVTYSNEFKIKMGVKSSLIDKYTVYSLEIARDMAKVISEFTSSDYGIGVTGKLNKPDVYNMTGNDNLVFVSIYERKNNKYDELKILVSSENTEINKNEVLNQIKTKLLEILNAK